ncbi:MAG TPA: hypothetical protein VGO60_10640 [Iamia sp.]|jgi:hypothetical protein|nr:hypothetical protein [Iamia sp.]
MPPRTAAVVVSVLALATAATGCGGDDPDHLAAGDDFSVEGALAELPVPDLDDAPGIMVTVVDLEAAAEANEAGERPDADADEVGRWFSTATGSSTDAEDVPPVFVPSVDTLGGNQLASLDEIRVELGWTFLDVDAVAEVLAAPFRFGVVAGDVGPETLKDAGLEETEEGVFAVGEGEDGEVDPEGATPARPLGSPLRTAAEDGRLVVASSTEAVFQWVDGEPETLAEDDDLRAVAAALDDADAVSAYLTTAVPGSGAEGDDEQERFTAIGIGWAVEDGESRIAVVYAYDSEEAAETAVDQVEAAYGATTTTTNTPVSDQLALDDVEAKGAVVVAHVHPGPDGRPQSPLAMLQQGDVPFRVS